ncbi:MAG TPA: sugar transferase [Bryobacteraceae bacterium]|nr:sugar transferase [Bryobacteraceae bacterium]
MRRIIDIVVSLAALVVISPVLAIAGLAVALESSGGPLYFAPRVGKDGRPFRMWKLRTMRQRSGSQGPAITSKGDPRVTRLGRVLRNTKVDELPQFVNVLLGDMTLVGPRPEAPEFVELYTPEQRRILDYWPGVTGPVQLDSFNESDQIAAGAEGAEQYSNRIMGQKIDADLNYLQNRSGVSDARVVGATAVAVVRSLLNFD